MCQILALREVLYTVDALRSQGAQEAVKRAERSQGGYQKAKCTAPVASPLGLVMLTCRSSKGASQQDFYCNQFMQVDQFEHS